MDRSSAMRIELLVGDALGRWRILSSGLFLLGLVGLASQFRHRSLMVFVRRGRHVNHDFLVSIFGDLLDVFYNHMVYCHEFEDAVPKLNPSFTMFCWRTKV